MNSRIPGAAQFSGKRVAVLGLGLSGQAAIQALLDHTEAIVSAWDGRSQALSQCAAISEHQLDCGSHDDPAQLVQLIQCWQPDEVVISPAFEQTGIVWQVLRAAGIRVYSEIELAWQLRAVDDAGNYAPWLCVTGTNGKTTTVSMLAHILNAAGLRAQAIGNVGNPAVSAVSDCSAQAAQAFAVELSSFQLAATQSLAAHAAVCLNFADDHLEWHGSREEYLAAKARIFQRADHVLMPVSDPYVAQMVAMHVPDDVRCIGLSLGAPAAYQMGIVEELVLDRVYAPGAPENAEVLFTFDDIRHLSPEGALGAHIIQDAIAAAGLARTIGVDSPLISTALRSFQIGHHRIETVGMVDDVRYIDDSKATNAHAAFASLISLDRVVWIVGGQAKGARFDELVAKVAHRLRAVVVIGVDQEPWRAALAQLDVPVTYIAPDSADPMGEAVTAAQGYAEPGDTVILAPACASLDQFTSYAERGQRFTASVEGLVQNG
ncbi:UDP-N-acetylmuramoyl-L-alanine--D-glutamate ligase [Trueperella sp. LYQ143]|uniref:UDP-N-acetylmuramoyl-L-alanine--D-glutamate ligase n=1 Tax=unclassified Trueperella TaxID=2630174 RepID=UPI003983D204